MEQTAAPMTAAASARMPGELVRNDSHSAALAAATGVELALDSYQVHSVGVGRDARGEANLSVRHDDGSGAGTAYDGTGTSRDIIEASAFAWLDVANRILRRAESAPASQRTAAHA